MTVEGSAGAINNKSLTIVGAFHCLAESEGLISLIHSRGSSKETLSLRYTSLPVFFAPGFYELMPVSPETKNAVRFLSKQHFFVESEGLPTAPLLPPVFP